MWGDCVFGSWWDGRVGGHGGGGRGFLQGKGSFGKRCEGGGGDGHKLKLQRLDEAEFCCGRYG